MQLDLSADQKDFLATTRKFLDRRVPITAVREASGSSGPFDRAWWPAAAELGWTALLVPEELGGGSISGEGLCDLAVVAEALGKVVAPGPLIPANVVISALAEAPQRSADQDKTLEALISGEQIGSWAIYEPASSGVRRIPAPPPPPTVTATGSTA